MIKTGKKILVAAGCILLLCGCTKSNIVQPADNAKEPDFNIYNNIEMDMEQFHSDVEDVCLDADDYPMAAAVDFDIDDDKKLVTVTAVVKDGTDAQDAAEYADGVIKAIGDEAATQDYSYTESGEDTFGSYFDDRAISLKIYEQSSYEAQGDPMYETEIPAGTYMTFDIAE